MKNLFFNKLVLCISVINLILFVVNTFFIKFLNRDLFYFSGLYIPAILFSIYFFTLIFFLVKQRNINLAVLIFVLIVNLITFLLYAFYMTKAIKVR